MPQKIYILKSFYKYVKNKMNYFVLS